MKSSGGSLHSDLRYFLYCGLQSELVNLHVLHLSLATLGDIFSSTNCV